MDRCKMDGVENATRSTFAIVVRQAIRALKNTASQFAAPLTTLESATGYQ